MMKIGLFIDTFFPMIDGVIMVVDNYARRLSKFADVTVFCPGTKGYDYSSLPYRVVTCRQISFPKMQYALPSPKTDVAFMKALAESDLDIVHIHSPFMVGKMGVAYAKRHKIPVVATLHSQFYLDFYRATHSKLLSSILLKSFPVPVFNSVDECWAVNRGIQDLAVNYYDIKSPVRVQNNGTDMKPLSDPEGAKAKINARHGLSPNEKVLLFVGRLNDNKNILFLSRAFAKICEKSHAFRLIYVGFGPDEEKLRALIQQLGIENRVILAGEVKDRTEIAEYYARADLFAFPSLYDASSLVQIEAASQKTPALFIRGARTASTVTPFVNGYVAEGNEDAFATEVLKIFAEPEEYNKVCENAYRDLYVTWDGAISDIYSQYERVIEKINRKQKKIG